MEVSPPSRACPADLSSWNRYFGRVRADYNKHVFASRKIDVSSRRRACAREGARYTSTLFPSPGGVAQRQSRGLISFHARDDRSVGHDLPSGFLFYLGRRRLDDGPDTVGTGITAGPNPRHG